MNHKLIVFLMCLGLAAAAAGQGGKLSGNISGGVAGSNAGTTIILTNTNTGMSHRVTVSPDGTFNTSVEPGTYRVEVERNGQRQTATRNLVVPVNTNSQISMQIQMGPVSETVEIEAQAPTLQDEPPEVGRAYPTRFVREIPVFDRNYQELNGLPAGTTPPVVTSANVTTDPQRGRVYDTNGLPPFVNGNLEDGTTNREPVTQTLSVRVLPDEAVEQLNVITNNYSSDMGYSAGAISNVLTRPGTNGVHGSAFGFFTNDYFSTHNALVPAGVGEPTTHHKQYGGTLGGPIIPDKLFLFLSYQGAHDAGTTIEHATVPTADMRSGDFSALGVSLYNPFTGVTTGPSAGEGRIPFPGQIVPAALFDPASRAILSALPLPNLAGFSNNLATLVPQSIDSNVGDGKLDYRFSDALTGYLRYGISNFNATQNSIFGSAIGDPTRSGLRNHHAAVSLVGNHRGILAELRFGYSRYRNSITSSADPGALGRLLSGLGFAGTSLPPMTIEGLGTLGVAAGTPSKDIDNIYDGAANFHMYRGSHQITFGVNIRAELSDGFLDRVIGPFGPNGGFNFGPGPTSLAGAEPGGPNSAFASSFASFLLGTPTIGGVFAPSVTPSFRQTQYSGYASDLVHMGTRFSLDIGIRYDVFSPVTTRHAAGATFYNPAANTATLVSELNHGDYDLNNISPRIGFAFRLREHTVFRAGYSMNYYPLPFLLSGLNVAGSGTSAGVVGSLAATPFTVPTVPPPTGTPVEGTSTPAQNIPYLYPTGFQTPYTENYYAMIQQDLPAGFLIDVGYAGNVARQLPYTLNLNASLPGAGLAGLPFATAGRTAASTEVGQGLTSNYNALQVNLTKPLSHGAAIGLAYTYGKALDYGLVQLNNFNRRSNYGPADWDHTQILTISHLFALPVGRGSSHFNKGAVGQILGNWEVIGLFRWATGNPYSAIADPVACACPGNTSIFASATAGAGGIVSGNAFPSPILFSAPPAGTFGASGRNAFRGPDLTSYNLSLFKSFTVRENTKVELRGEAYNLLNNVQYANPPSNVSFANFGQPTSTVNGVGGRTFQVGVRVLF